MATHSSIAWRIPWTEEPGELQPLGLQRVRHDWVTTPLLLLMCCASPVSTVITTLAPVEEKVVELHTAGRRTLMQGNGYSYGKAGKDEPEWEKRDKAIVTQICGESDPVTVLLFTWTQFIRMWDCFLSLTCQSPLSSVDKTLLSRRTTDNLSLILNLKVCFYTKVYFLQKF